MSRARCNYCYLEDLKLYALQVRQPLELLPSQCPDGASYDHITEADIAEAMQVTLVEVRQRIGHLPETDQREAIRLATEAMQKTAERVRKEDDGVSVIIGGVFAAWLFSIPPFCVCQYLEK